MQEKIGKITLDYEFYPGEDFYCDGTVEDTLLQIVKEHPKAEYDCVIEEKASWPILYHLSELRGNIVKWIPMDKKAKVLEVGAGCGAITGTLAQMAGSVTCVDLSKKRSLINAYRNSAYDNITIHVGNFKDIEPVLENDYDYVMLIGVFEYGQAYIGGEHPYEEFMRILKQHLKPDGHLVIAIENQFGLKYWAGCAEDHLGTYFSGLMNYPEGGAVRTFTRRGLEEILKKSGIEEYHFYYPYPDYKFMHALYSDERLPKEGELSMNLRNFDRDRMRLFDEQAVFDTVIRENEFPLFSNSYLVITGKMPVSEENYFFDTKGADMLERMRQKIGNAVVNPAAGECCIMRGEREKYRVQLYLDYGNGFSEEQSVFLSEEVRSGERIAFSYQIPEGVRNLRMDPAGFCCLVTIDRLSVNGRPVRSGKWRTQAKRFGKRSFVFATDDPWILIKQPGNGCLEVEMDCVRLAAETAARM